jgi:hypothetical protein
MFLSMFIMRRRFLINKMFLDFLALNLTLLRQPPLRFHGVGPLYDVDPGKPYHFKTILLLMRPSI